MPNPPKPSHDTSATPATSTPATRPGIAHHWPVLAGIAAAALIGLDMSEGVDAAPALAASALIYFGAAALRKPSSVWPLFFGTVAVIFATELWGGGDVDPTWVILALAVPFLAYGLLQGRRTPNAPPPHGGWPYHLTAMAAFGAAAATALGVTQTVGAYFVAGGLLAHAAWDAYHYRIDKVVTRSLAEFCLVLDTVIAAVIVIVTVTD
ncbi:hypothetical protein PV396_43780 [Streptomyces sp. ME02-8801-2C]|uniref:hypothetical protein n=1 Tax=Streptomyces sp. ME02-8801-2C TaxID=3028680 RepID=UPI0029ACC96C|nr:hypothetical protein [Streptomyces sp. ME02-8801-2C]MDX3458766.1 hypothetical protein [Streptomyces sp. ME02-8801-2C]